jgi:hypothetical protein
MNGKLPGREESAGYVRGRKRQTKTRPNQRTAKTLVQKGGKRKQNRGSTPKLEQYRKSNCSTFSATRWVLASAQSVCIVCYNCLLSVCSIWRSHWVLRSILFMAKTEVSPFALFRPNIKLVFVRKSSLCTSLVIGGKSSILVGLQTCLGARASDTGRGSSLKELIEYSSPWVSRTYSCGQLLWSVYIYQHCTPHCALVFISGAPKSL